MRKPLLILGLLLLLFGTLNAQGFLPFHDLVDDDQKAEELTYTKAVLRTASGCKLNKYSQVKAFIADGATKYGLAVDMKAGGDPRIIFFDKNDREVMTLVIVDLDAAGIEKILEDRGFKKLSA